MELLINPMKALASEVLRKGVEDVAVDFLRTDMLEYWCAMADVNVRDVTEAIVCEAVNRKLMDENTAWEVYGVDYSQAITRIAVKGARKKNEVRIKRNIRASQKS